MEKKIPGGVVIGYTEEKEEKPVKKTGKKK